jgi:hypothetical protein
MTDTLFSPPNPGKSRGDEWTSPVGGKERKEGGVDEQRLFHGQNEEPDHHKESRSDN